MELSSNLDIYYVFHGNCTQSLLKINHKRLVKSVKVFLASIKSINSVQKYLHIIESYACILKIFVTTIDLSINILISFGICSTKVSN